MSKKDKKSKQPRVMVASAPPHPVLEDHLVHVFVDDQNLFYGITNQSYGKGYRIDFGRLLTESARDSSGKARGVQSAYIAGVVPDDDSFWKIAEDRGFVVHRGYLSYAGGYTRSKQDDAYLITSMVATSYEYRPGTMVLLAGDADYMPPLKHVLTRGWRVEILFIDRGMSTALLPVCHELRELFPEQIRFHPDLGL